MKSSKTIPTSSDLSAQTRELFQNAGSDIPPIPFKNQAQLLQEFDTIAANIDERKDWSDQTNAINKLMGLINAGALKNEQFVKELVKINTGLIDASNNLRSTLVKKSCLLIAQLSRELKNKFEIMGEMIFPLSSQTSHGTQIIAESCKYAILSIGMYCQTKRTLGSILELSKSKSVNNRCISAECICNVLNNWNKNIIENNYARICEVTKKLITDSNPETRNFARKASSLIIKAFPQKKDEYLDGIDSRNIKQIEALCQKENENKNTETPKYKTTNENKKKKIEETPSSTSKSQSVQIERYETPKINNKNAKFESPQSSKSQNQKRKTPKSKQQQIVLKAKSLSNKKGKSNQNKENIIESPKISVTLKPNQKRTPKNANKQISKTIMKTPEIEVFTPNDINVQKNFNDENILSFDDEFQMLFEDNNNQIKSDEEFSLKQKEVDSDKSDETETSDKEQEVKSNNESTETTSQENSDESQISDKSESSLNQEEDESETHNNSESESSSIRIEHEEEDENETPIDEEDSNEKENDFTTVEVINQNEENTKSDNNEIESDSNLDEKEVKEQKTDKNKEIYSKEEKIEEIEVDITEEQNKDEEKQSKENIIDDTSNEKIEITNDDEKVNENIIEELDSKEENNIDNELQSKSKEDLSKLEIEENVKEEKLEENNETKDENNISENQEEEEPKILIISDQEVESQNEEQKDFQTVEIIKSKEEGEEQKQVKSANENNEEQNNNEIENKYESETNGTLNIKEDEIENQNIEITKTQKPEIKQNMHKNEEEQQSIEIKQKQNVAENEEEQQNIKFEKSQKSEIKQKQSIPEIKDEQQNINIEKSQKSEIKQKQSIPEIKDEQQNIKMEKTQKSKLNSKQKIKDNNNEKHNIKENEVEHRVTNLKRSKSPHRSQIPEIRSHSHKTNFIPPPKFNRSLSNAYTNKKYDDSSPYKTKIRSSLDTKSSFRIKLEEGEEITFLNQISNYINSGRQKDLNNSIKQIIPGLIVCSVHENTKISSQSLRLILDSIPIFRNEFESSLVSLLEILFNQLTCETSESEYLIPSILKEIESIYDPNILLSIASKQAYSKPLMRFVSSLCMQKDTNLTDSNLCSFIIDIVFQYQEDTSKIRKILYCIGHQNPLIIRKEIIRNVYNKEILISILSDIEDRNNDIPKFNPRNVLKWCNDIMNYIKNIKNNQWNYYNLFVYEEITEALEETNEYNIIFGLTLDIMKFKGTDLYEMIIPPMLVHIKERKSTNVKLLFEYLKENIQISSLIKSILCVANGNDPELIRNSLFAIGILLKNDESEDVEAEIDDIAKLLKKLINNENPDIRRSAVYCYVDLYVKHKNKIEKYVKELTTNQQKLIKLYRNIE